MKKRNFEIYIVMLKDFNNGVDFKKGKEIGLNDIHLANWLIENGYAEKQKK